MKFFQSAAPPSVLSLQRRISSPKPFLASRQSCKQNEYVNVIIKDLVKQKLMITKNRRFGFRLAAVNGERKRKETKLRRRHQTKAF